MSTSSAGMNDSQSRMTTDVAVKLGGASGAPGPMSRTVSFSIARVITTISAIASAARLSQRVPVTGSSW
ncbi:MAG: hypothetical protein QM770_02325 [Tepidisphaeraceae bacterium]